MLCQSCQAAPVVLRSRCRRCYSREIRKGSPESQRAYYERNKEARRAAARAYYHAHKDAVLAQQREYYKAERERQMVTGVVPVPVKGWGYSG